MQAGSSCACGSEKAFTCNAIVRCFHCASFRRLCRAARTLCRAERSVTVPGLVRECGQSEEERRNFPRTQEQRTARSQNVPCWHVRHTCREASQDVVCRGSRTQWTSLCLSSRGVQTERHTPPPSQKKSPKCALDFVEQRTEITKRARFLLSSVCFPAQWAVAFLRDVRGLLG